jgi:hypothetical protein
MWKRVAAVILLILLGASAYILWPEWANLDDLVDAGPAYDVRILRDDKNIAPAKSLDRPPEINYG